MILMITNGLDQERQQEIVIILHFHMEMEGSKTNQR